MKIFKTANTKIFKTMPWPYLVDFVLNILISIVFKSFLVTDLVSSVFQE